MSMLPHDFGPIYRETDMSRFPVEPWNTASNLIFLLLIVYYARRTRFDGRTHPLIVISLPILLVGFAGGTVYHAARSHPLWLYLDFMPIFVLALLASCHFWGELLKSTVRAVLVALALFALVSLVRKALHVPAGLAISVGYSMLALLIVAPALLVARAQAWKDVHLVLLAVGAFLAAVACRTADAALGKTFLPMGTHWLWHLLGGCAVYFLIEFVYRRDDKGGITLTTCSGKYKLPRVIEQLRRS